MGRVVEWVETAREDQNGNRVIVDQSITID